MSSDPLSLRGAEAYWQAARNLAAELQRRATISSWSNGAKTSITAGAAGAAGAPAAEVRTLAKIPEYHVLMMGCHVGSAIGSAVLRGASLGQAVVASAMVFMQPWPTWLIFIL